MIAGLLKWAKAWAVVGMLSRAAVAVAVVVPVAGMVAAGGGEISISVKLGDT